MTALHFSDEDDTFSAKISMRTFCEFVVNLMRFRTLTAFDFRNERIDDAWESSIALSWNRRPRTPISAPSHEVRMVLRVHDDASFIAESVALSRGPDAACFLPLLTCLAGATSSRLRIDAPVDAIALQGAFDASKLFARWGWLKDVSPTASGSVRHQSPLPRRTGLFFSRGLDSMSSLVSMIDSGAAPDALLALDWVDPPYATDGTMEVIKATTAAAEDFGIPLVRLSTNARQWLDVYSGWDQVFGATLAASALALDQIVDNVGIASTHPISVRIPHGSHPDLDGLWSSSRVSIHHRHDVPGGRIDRAAAVMDNALAMRHLKVCWERAGDGNCGRCTKCLLTLADFWLAGASDDAMSIFDSKLTTEAVRSIANAPKASSANIVDVVNGFSAVATGSAPIPAHRDPATAVAFAAEQAEVWSVVASNRRPLELR